MRHASRVAAAARQARPQRALEQAAALATHAPTVVHPPHQSVRPGFTKDDPSHTSKWLQARTRVSLRAARPGAYPRAMLSCAQAPTRSPQDWISSVPPQEVKGSNIARCVGGAAPEHSQRSRDPF